MRGKSERGQRLDVHVAASQKQAASHAFAAPEKHAIKQSMGSSRELKSWRPGHPGTLTQVVPVLQALQRLAVGVAKRGVLQRWKHKP